MNCYQHAESPAVAFCRSCGRPLCSVCQRVEEGTVYCDEHAPSMAYAGGGAAANPYMAPPPPPPPTPVTPIQTSPGLAFLLGLIPGVGAIYNGQYVKGLLHAVVFGLLVSITNGTDESSGHIFLSICTMAFYFYMPFEAYHTARKRQLGLPVEEWSSLVGQNRFSSSVPMGPIVLIAIGILFLLHSLHVLDFRAIGRFWPVVLIIIGGAMLYGRLRGRPASTPAPPVQPHFVETTRE